MDLWLANTPVFASLFRLQRCDFTLNGTWQKRLSLYTISMEQVLYRKYRSKNFKEVLGQEPIVKALEGALSLGRISHAYLFAGSRGIGKTSVARILAREIGASQNDTYEIDAASHTGVDDIRELNDAVRTFPFESKYKVYIIDEVHMLSKSAFNALLKTLEEPPAHVVFILATTEIEKLPETVVSRCQVFQFKKPSQEILREMVLRIAKKEGFTLEPSSADLIALLGDGSFRDTQGILQKVITSSADKKISVKEVEAMTGAPQGTLVNAFIEAIDQKKPADGMKAVAKVVEQNGDMKVFLKLTLRKLRFVLLLRYAVDMEKGIKEELSPDDFALLKKIAEHKEGAVNSAALLELLTAYDNLSFYVIPELPLELALIKLSGEKG